MTTELLHQRIVAEGPRDDGPDERSQEDYEYVSSYLEAAKTFVRDAASQGRGIVYYIG